jgi:transposase InsO family protein
MADTRRFEPGGYRYNSSRPHSALGGKPPISRIAGNNVLGNDI